MKSNVIKKTVYSISEEPMKTKIISARGEQSYHNMLATENEVLIEQIEYDCNGLSVVGHILQPKAPGKYPCIVFCRGGNRDFGTMNPLSLYFYLSYFVKKGFIVISSQYPGSTGSDGKDEHGGENDLASLECLVPILSEIENADTKNLFLLGGSRGGMMAYMLLRRKNTKYSAVAIRAGLADLQRSQDVRPNMTKEFEETFGNTAVGISDRSAVNWASEIEPTPILIMHGQNDDKVPVQDALDMYSKLSVNGAPTKLIIWENDDHDLSKHHTQQMNEIVSWFEAYRILE